MSIRCKQLIGILMSVVLAMGSLLVPVSAKEKTDITELLKIKSRAAYNKGRQGRDSCKKVSFYR